MEATTILTRGGIHPVVPKTFSSGVKSGCRVKASLKFGGWKLGDEHVVATATQRARSPKRYEQFLRDNEVDVFGA
jgi:hypothetical protein